jgi:hypothetical protein
MSVDSILCAILKVSIILVQHSVNGNPYRDSYTVTYPRYEENYLKERIFREEGILNEENSGLVLLTDNYRNFTHVENISLFIIIESFILAQSLFVNSYTLFSRVSSYNN